MNGTGEQLKDKKGHLVHLEWDVFVKDYLRKSQSGWRATQSWLTVIYECVNWFILGATGPNSREWKRYKLYNREDLHNAIEQVSALDCTFSFAFLQLSLQSRGFFAKLAFLVCQRIHQATALLRHRRAKKCQLSGWLDLQNKKWAFSFFLRRLAYIHCNFAELLRRWVHLIFALVVLQLGLIMGFLCSLLRLGLVSLICELF